MSGTKATVKLKVDGDFQEYVRIGKMGGAQKKAEIAGQYEEAHPATKPDSRTRRYFIKSSLNYPADDAVEVVASSLMQKLIPQITNPNPEAGALIAPARFAIDTDEKHIYVRSEAFPKFTQLVDMKGIKELGLRSDTPFMMPMLGANPFFERNKKNLVSFILDDTDSPLDPPERARLRREFSQILVSAYLMGDYDVQPKNIGLYQGTDGRYHFCKIDHGWALANLGKAKYLEERSEVKSIDEPKALIAEKATHAKGAVPTNHFNDYPDIISSKEFKEVIREMTSDENLEDLTKHIRVALDSIDKLPADKKLMYYQHLADHMRLKISYTDSSGQSLSTSTRPKMEALMTVAAKEQLETALVQIIMSRANALHGQQCAWEARRTTVLETTTKQPIHHLHEPGLTPSTLSIPGTPTEPTPPPTPPADSPASTPRESPRPGKR